MGQRAQDKPWGHPGSPTHPGWPGRCWSLLGCSATVSFRRSRQTWLAGAFSSSSSPGGPGSGGARRTGWQRALPAAPPGRGTLNQPPTTCSSTGTGQQYFTLPPPPNHIPSSGCPWEGIPRPHGTTSAHLPATPAQTCLCPPPLGRLCCSHPDSSCSSSLDSSSA